MMRRAVAGALCGILAFLTSGFVRAQTPPPAPPPPAPPAQPSNPTSPNPPTAPETAPTAPAEPAPPTDAPKPETPPDDDETDAAVPGTEPIPGVPASEQAMAQEKPAVPAEPND